jgi:chemotaxis response regulator CheB
VDHSFHDLSYVRRHGTSVLIVDDDDQVRALLARIVERSTRFSTIWQADDAAEGVFQARRHNPDIILLDYDMPWMTAGAARRYLEDFRGVVIMVSGAIRNDCAEWVDAFVSKTALEQLVPTMIRALELRAASSQAP